MSTSPDSRQEDAHTHGGPESAIEQELPRLQGRERWMNTVMEGIPGELSGPAPRKRVLDIGCGPGDWLLEMAAIYPDIAWFIGIDTDSRLVKFAREQGQARRLNERVEFHTVQAWSRLEFPEKFFNLVNVRAAMHHLLVADWLPFLQGCRHICHLGGVIRLVDMPINVLPAEKGGSPALVRLAELTNQAFYQAGHLPTPHSAGLVRELPGLLESAGLRQIQAREYTQIVQQGDKDWPVAYDELCLFFLNARAFVEQWLPSTDNYESNYQQMLEEIQRPDFKAALTLHTVWGEV